jgi:hypothetical protein
MPRKRERDAPPVVYPTARCGLRVTRAQRNRLFGLLRSAGDVWCAVLELNRWRRSRRDPPLAGYRELCRELAASGPGTFGELDIAGPGGCCAALKARGQRTAEPGRTCQARTRHDVTPGDGPPSRPPAHGPLAGTGPPSTATTQRGVARHPARSPQARHPTPTNLGQMH